MIEESTYFAEQLEEISAIYLKTSYGNIYAQAVGKPGQPLIIVVHGSGPRNSSDQYLYMLHQYLVRVSYIEKFFIIAIDCPGYGRSKGSKQAVKTFPLQMFKQILADLKYKSYYAMMGHSQGGAAIFNAVYQDPSLTQFLLMDRPVCGNIKRFNKFHLPTLMIYDIEDDGHPIWQGKLLYKELSKSQLYTYRHSRNPYFVPDNLWDLIISFFRRNSKNLRQGIFTQNQRSRIRNHNNYSLSPERKKSAPKLLNNEVRGNKEQKMALQQQFKVDEGKKHSSMDKYREIKREKQSQEKKIMDQIPQIDKSQIYSRIADLEEFEELPNSMNQPKIQQAPEQALKYQCKEIKEGQNIPKSKKEEKTPQQKIQKKEQLTKNSTNIKKQQNKISQEDDKCSICMQVFFQPQETNCKHNFCKKCLGESILMDNRCPLCRTKITKRRLNLVIKQRTQSKFSQDERKKKQAQLNKFQQILKSIVYIQIGNNSKQLPTKPSSFAKTKKKYIWELYVKEPKNFKLEEVSFDINIGETGSKPIKVTNSPFIFQSRGTFSFNCEISIKPRNRDYAPIKTTYRIEVEPGNHSKTLALRKRKNN